MDNIKYSAFKLVNQRLLNFSFETNKQFKPKKNINLVLNADKKIDKDEAKKLAIVTFTLAIFNEAIKKDSPFILEITMEGTFKWDDSISPKAASELLKTNSPAILLGYMRPFISQITTYAGYSPLILPLIDFSTIEKK